MIVWFFKLTMRQLLNLVRFPLKKAVQRSITFLIKNENGKPWQGYFSSDFSIGVINKILSGLKIAHCIKKKVTVKSYSSVGFGTAWCMEVEKDRKRPTPS